jgi:hypothetical protein
LIYSYEWDGKKFVRKFIGNISEIFEVYSENYILPDIMHNSMEAQIKDVDADGKNEIIVAGMSHTRKFGWEATTLGFITIFKQIDTGWTHKVLDTYSVLGTDIGKID